MTPAEVQRRVGQLDNDVQSIYELLDHLKLGTTRISATQSRHANRLNELARHLEAHDQRFDAVDQRFDAVDRRFNAVDQRFDAVDQRFDGIDTRLDGLDSKMDQVLEILRAR